ncbi:hypothetical protein MMC11_002261 [Xylographa trunciseda]|nr:hypothetical protein [Xylographa trunciseda]
MAYIITQAQSGHRAREPLAPLSNAVNIAPTNAISSKPSLDLKSTSAKRSHSAVDDSQEEIQDDDYRLLFRKDSCDQIRTKINAFINNGGMKVGEFQRAIGVNSSAYAGFMKQHGCNAGNRSSVYSAASVFFTERELQGQKMPKKKAKKDIDANGKTIGTGVDYDVSDIHLEGEDEEAVEIYDTCDEIRRKIAAHLRAPGVTQAAFCRAISAQFPDAATKKISASQLLSFLRKKGPMEGNSSGVFYVAYVFFEKLRIKKGRKKSKARLEMEEVWGDDGGVSRELDRGYLCSRDTDVVRDQYGKVNFVRKIVIAESSPKMRTKVYGKKGRGLLGTRSAVFEQDSPNTNHARRDEDTKVSRTVLKESTGNPKGVDQKKKGAYEDGQEMKDCKTKCRVHAPQNIVKINDPAGITKHREIVKLKSVERMTSSATGAIVKKSNTTLLHGSVQIPLEYDVDAIEGSPPLDLLSMREKSGSKDPMMRQRMKHPQNSSSQDINEISMLLKDRLVVTETLKWHHKDVTTGPDSFPIAAPAFQEQPAILDTETAFYVSPILACKNVSGRVENFQAWTDERMATLKMQKIGEGSFGEVYRATNNGETVIMKIIPLNARKGRGSRTFTSIEAAANEVQLLEKMQKIPGFVEFRGACVLRGSMPSQLVKEWNDYKAQDRTVESKDPNKKNVYLDSQLWLLVEMSDAGTNLNPGQYVPCDTMCNKPGNRYLSVQRSWDIFWQIVMALAKAEVYAQFEHRDLHLGNICAKNIRPICEKEDFTLVPCGEATAFSLDNTGVQVTIIDYSLARAIADGDRILSYDFMKNDTILKGEGDLQYDIYRYMAEAVRKKCCKEFVPKTNLLWLSYLIIKLLEVTVELSEEAKFEEKGFITVTAKMKAILEDVKSIIALSKREQWELQSAGELLNLGAKNDWFSLEEIIAG